MEVNLTYGYLCKSYMAICHSYVSLNEQAEQLLNRRPYVLGWMPEVRTISYDIMGVRQAKWYCKPNSLDTPNLFFSSVDVFFQKKNVRHNFLKANHWEFWAGDLYLPRRIC